jgi:hypothetical protein
LKGDSSRKEKKFDPVRKDSGGFYRHRVMNGFIEGELFQGKRMNLTVYERVG